MLTINWGGVGGGLGCFTPVELTLEAPQTNALRLSTYRLKEALRPTEIETLDEIEFEAIH